MAWHYPVHACTHKGERINLVGKMDSRSRRLDAIERQPCPACRAAEGNAAADAAGWPKLTGSDNQIAWATQIRAEARRVTPEDIARQTRAGWWIDHRHEF